MKTLSVFWIHNNISAFVSGAIKLNVPKTYDCHRSLVYLKMYNYYSSQNKLLVTGILW